MPRLVITNRAEGDLASLRQDLRDEADRDILAVGASPREAGYHLKGTYYCRWSTYTAGNRRILYRIEEGSVERVVILGLPHRNIAYPRGRR